MTIAFDVFCDNYPHGRLATLDEALQKVQAGAGEYCNLKVLLDGAWRIIPVVIDNGGRRTGFLPETLGIENHRKATEDRRQAIGFNMTRGE